MPTADPFIPDLAASSTARYRKSPAPAHVRPSVIEMAAEADVDDAFAAIVAGARDHWLANDTAARAGRDIEGVHQVRVALRRLRSALTLFKKFLPHAQRDWLNGEARWLLGELGPVRDLDVFLAELVPAAACDTAGVSALIKAASSARRLAQDKARAALASQRARRLEARLDAWLSGRGWRNGMAKDGRALPARSFAQRALNKRLIAILAHGKRIDTLPVPELHELRIAVKKVRYGVEFFRSVLPKRRAAKLAEALKDLQDSLGHLNDLDVAAQIVGQISTAAKTAKAGQSIAAAGARIVAHHRRAADDAVTGIAPRWRKVRSCGLL